MSNEYAYSGKTQLYIDGVWRDSSSGQMRDILYPCTGEAIARVAEGTSEDVDAAVDAARRAFDAGPWPKTPAAERGVLVEGIAEALEDHAEEMARLESLDTGKPLEESQWDMADSAAAFRYFGQLADKHGGELIASPNPDCVSRVVREPAGVAAQIVPWNYPLLQTAFKVAPALAAGCSMVLKPSELTPLTALYLAGLIEKAGLPAGVFNLVPGAGETVGARMTEHPAVDLVSFTGGLATGKAVLKAASDTVKKVTLELGGKNPNIVFADADFDTAVDYALNAVFFNAGQICSAGSRLLVEASIADDFVRALASRIEKIPLGDSFDPDTRMGPLISAEHLSKVEGYMKVAEEEGARVMAGARRPDTPPHAGGFYFLPTLITGVHNSMRLAKEEIFGPVITVESFETEEQAVAWANDTEYGLSAAVWTRSGARADRVASALKAGTVWINDYNIFFPQAPWGGYKRSGLGRELGKAGLEEYTELKHIYRNNKPVPMNWF